MNTSLPIYKHKDEIVNALKEHNTVIITAETGSGKSTQVPQYLYEAGYTVICTQPRRMACITLADRVSEELVEYYNDIQLNQIVGYKTAFEDTTSSSTKVLFCTDGLQLARGIKDFNNTVLIIDEVHEWNLNIETLIAWVHDAQNKGKNIKVVLMSATVDSQDLKKFFTNACVLHCSGRLYTVEMFNKDPWEQNSIVKQCVEEGKNVLLFKPGKKEITEAIEELTEKLSDTPVTILPFHADLTILEQKKCFKKYSEPKVIVATNIAQTSLTISDINVVVDDGYVKQVEVIEGVESLLIRNISKADCKQRAGRAGRVQDGKYYLCSQTTYEERDDYPVPEIERLLLDRVVLKLASVNIDAYDITFYHQPSHKKIHDARKLLRMFKALDEQSHITELGKDLIHIPTSVRYAKLIHDTQPYGKATVEAAMKIASILEVGSLLNHRFKRKVNSFIGTMEFNITYMDLGINESQSDLLAELQLYENACDYKYDNLSSSGINVKNFFKVKELYVKLKDTLSNILTYDSVAEVNRDGLVQSIVASMCDSLCIYRYDDYQDFSNKHLNPPKSSCVRGNANNRWAVGIPREIHYKDRWGDTRSMLLLTFMTTVSEEIASKYFPIEPTLKHLYDTAMYDINTDSIVIQVERTINDLHLSTVTMAYTKEDPEYNRILTYVPDIITKETDKFVLINGKQYTVHNLDFSWMKPCVYLELDDLIGIPDHVTAIRTSSGKQIDIECYGMRDNNVKGLKRKLAHKLAEYKVRGYLESLPSKVGTAQKLSDLFDYCGVKHFDEVTFDYHKDIFVGLELVGESACLTTFDTESEAINSTNEVCKFFINKYARTTYPDKKFVEKREGKKQETKRTIKAKTDWHDYLIEVVADTTKDDYQSNLTFVDDLYKELTADFNK